MNNLCGGYLGKLGECVCEGVITSDRDFISQREQPGLQKEQIFLLNILVILIPAVMKKWFLPLRKICYLP